MKKSFRDVFSDVVIFFIRPIVTFLMKREMKVVHTGQRIKRNKGPFILISNHFNTWDSFVVMANVKKNIRFVATEIAFLDFMKKIGMKHLARAITKRVGKSDYVATKRIFDSLKQGYAIGLFPEGDNTFYGETLDIYANTGRLIKKANVEVILIKQRGGYISQPRWADFFAKQGVVHTHTSTLINQEDLVNLTAVEINKIVEDAIYNNDYEFQREYMYDFNRIRRAEGIERLVYICNKCNGILSVFGEGHDIKCTNCGTIGTINEFEFIEGNEFDNLVDYNTFQYTQMDKVIESEFGFDVTLNLVDERKLKNIKLGPAKITYKDKVIHAKGEDFEYHFELSKIKYPCCTMRHSFSFDYENDTINFTDIRNQFVLYEMCRYNNGSYKE